MCSCSSSIGYYILKIRPNGTVLPGYAANKWWKKGGGIGDPRGKPKQTLAQCRAYATKRGYAGVGHRTDKHPSPKWRNTCFFYKKPSGAAGWQGNVRDKAHKVGCANPGKSWGSC